MKEVWNFDLIVKRTAWICLSIAGISVAAFVMYLYYQSNQYSSRREIDSVQFCVKLDDHIRSISGSKIVMNGVVQYFDVSRDSLGCLNIKTQIKNGFRPEGRIESKIYTINNAVIELRVDFKEGFNSNQRYVISPIVVDCDSLCKEYASVYRDLESLKGKTRLLSTALRALSPNGTIDTVLFNNAK